jgi:hypothetical protein
VKAFELFEARKKKDPPPEWVQDEARTFQAMVKRFGFDLQFDDKKMMAAERDGRWVTGGRITMPKEDNILTPERRMAGLVREFSKRMMKLQAEGKDPVVFSIRSRGMWLGPDIKPHFLWNLSLNRIEEVVKERLFLNSMSGGGYNNLFYYGFSEPKKEEPKEEPKPRVLRVVKKGQA